MNDLTAIAEQLDNVQEIEVKRSLLPDGYDEVKLYRQVNEVLDNHSRFKKDNLIFIDIETVPSESLPSIEEIKVPGNIKKPESILAYKTDPDKIEDQYRKEALISHKGRILCIGIAINDSKEVILAANSEKTILEMLDEVLGTHRRIQWVGFNIRRFDMLWIYQRAIKYNCKNVLACINTDRYNGNIIDLMDLLGGCLDYQYRISFDNVCKFLGIESPKQGIDGSKVYDYWVEGRVDEIFKYCGRDVNKNREVYKMIKG